MHKKLGAFLKRNRLLLPSSAALALLLLTAALSRATEPQYGGTLSIAVDLEFRGFNPLKTGYLQFGDRSVMMALQERLFDMDREGNLIPELALSATPAGATEWTVRLRDGVVFHDGTPFNADAVVQHWQRMLDPDNRYPGAIYIEPVAAVTRLDDLTVRFSLKHPWAPFKTMLSEARWSGAFIPSPKAMRDGTQNRAPVGTGPFRFEQWLPNDRLVVRRNPRYWREGRPYLDGVVFRPVADLQARFDLLRSGGSDLVLGDQGVALPAADGAGLWRIYSTDASGPYAFIVNTKARPLEDTRVRQALAHAWNQELFLEEYSGGTLPVARDPFGGALSCGAAGYREHDPEKARALLAEVAAPVTLELLEGDSARRRKAGEVVQQILAAAGISVKVVPMPEGEVVQRVMRGDYQLAAWRLMDLNDLGPYFNVTLHSAGKLNFSRYQSPEMDRLLKAQQLSAEPDTRERALCDIATLINREVIYLYAGSRKFDIVAKANIQGIGTVEQGIVRLAHTWLPKAPAAEARETVKPGARQREGKSLKKQRGRTAARLPAVEGSTPTRRPPARQVRYKR